MDPERTDGQQVIPRQFSPVARSSVYGFAVALLTWAGFAVAMVALSPLTRFETNAVTLACVVAILAAGAAVRLFHPERQFVTVFVASPLLVAAASLPPVVALLSWETYPAIPVSRVPFVVGFVQQRLLEPVGLARPFANTLDREAVGYTLSWLLYSVPLGWVLGSAIVHVRFLAGADV